jgi:hypothetical protein
MATDAARKLEAQRLEKLRLAERGYEELDRGYEEIDRGYEEIDRGYEEIDRGYEEIDRGGGLGFGRSARSSDAAVDLFRRAVGLGGHLKITFVAPIGASSPVSRRAPCRTRGMAPKADASAEIARIREEVRIKNAAPSKPVGAPLPKLTSS